MTAQADVYRSRRWDGWWCLRCTGCGNSMLIADNEQGRLLGRSWEGRHGTSCADEQNRAA